jgi:6-phosphogluconate dehydrogenase
MTVIVDLRGAVVARQGRAGQDQPVVGRGEVEAHMQVGMVGAGRMGASLARRLARAGVACTVCDVVPQAVDRLVAEGLPGVHALADLVASLERPRVVWLMVPADAVQPLVDQLEGLLDPGDVVVDGGNSRWTDDLARSARFAAQGVDYVDVGTSGGVFGLERGFCLMVGGADRAVGLLAPVLDVLAPGPHAAPRTPGRQGAYTPEERGWLHCGPSGAGHFVKMVHNGIEYGLMAAYAEGLALLAGAGAGSTARPVDAETAPLTHPEAYRYDLDLAAITEVWRRGSVVSSWLLDLTAAQLAADPGLAGFEGRVSDSGEGRWTVQAGVDLGVPTPVISAALYQRFASRDEGQVAARVLSAMRWAFGGHAERAEGGR